MKKSVGFVMGHVEPLFTRSAGVVLAATGIAKALSAIGPARALDSLDPLVGLPFRPGERGAALCGAATDHGPQRAGARLRTALSRRA